MAYVTPKIDWSESYDPSPEDFNRIEGNTKYNKETADSDRSTITTNTSNITTNTTDIDSLEAKVNQGVKTTDSPVFANMASGSNNNQDVRTTASPVFTGVTTDNVNIKQKLFTGTTDSGGNAIFTAIGVNANTILDIRCYYLTVGLWKLMRGGVDGELNSINTSTNLIVCDGEPSSITKPYRVFVTYED